MATLFMFLNSSLNVELVYIILKSITSLGVLTENELSKKSKAKVSISKTSGDGHLRLDKIKIRQYQNWSKQSNYSRNDKLIKTLELHEKVHVTYYKMRQF